MHTHSTKNTLMLLLTAFIWGTAFVAQSVGLSYIGPFTLNGLRFLIGAVVLIPCIWFLDRIKKTPAQKEKASLLAGENKKVLITGGICCGLALAVASTLQQFGIKYTSVGKAGFITALYIVIVPILGIFLKRKPRLLVWVSVALAFIGLYFLCVTGSLSFSMGDLLVLLSAFFFSIHIMIIDHFSPKTDGVRMSFIQFLVAGLILLVPILIFERPAIADILSAWAPLLYTGVLSSGLAYTLQIIAQKDYDPTIASLLLSLESVFSALAGWLILHQSLSPREFFGCVLMFGAIILAQLPDKHTRAS